MSTENIEEAKPIKILAKSFGEAEPVLDGHSLF